VPPPAKRPSYDPQALLNAQPVIVAVIDPDTYRVQFQNETGLQRFGDISGDTCHEKIAGCPTPCSFCKMPEAVKTGRITVNEVALSDDQYVLVQWSKAVTDDGRTHVIETITDVTERKRMEQAVGRSEKMDALGRLAGGIAHDFNNLLTIITGHSEHLLQQFDEDDPRAGRIKGIHGAVEQAASLTQHLIAFSHHQVLQPTVQDLNALVTSLDPALRSLLGTRIDLSIALEAEAGQVVADRGQLEQVILNLVTNGRDAMPEGGRLRIATTRALVDEATAHQHNARPGTYVELSVADTGVGIDAETQAHLFEPFYKRKGLGGGSGLGLAKVYGIIRQSGGFIELVSEPGAGSTFTISLPRCEAIPPAQVVGRPSESFQGHKNILIVEDDEDVRLVVGDMLRARGYRVSEACDGVQALQVLQESPDPVHMVLTDVMMPRMTGPELVRQLESLSLPVKVLYMSGYTDEILEPAAGQRLGFIQKPFTSTVLLQKVCETFSVSEPN
jgi:two-component system, cell cycle sensor histidine kinase and response regulator CckA